MSKQKTMNPKILEIANAIEGNTLEDLNEAINQIKKLLRSVQHFVSKYNV